MGVSILSSTLTSLNYCEIWRDSTWTVTLTVLLTSFPINQRRRKPVYHPVYENVAFAASSATSFTPPFTFSQQATRELDETTALPFDSSFFSQSPGAIAWICKETILIALIRNSFLYLITKKKYFLDCLSFKKEYFTRWKKLTLKYDDHAKILQSKYRQFRAKKLLKLLLKVKILR